MLGNFPTTLATWQPFFAAQLGAGAALLGLLFVGLSLNLGRILANPSLPLRAEIGLMLLGAAARRLLDPARSPTRAGWRSASRSCVFAGVFWLVTTTISLRIIRTTPPAERRHGWPDPRPSSSAAALPYLAGAAMILLAGGRAPSTPSPSA